MSPSWIFTPCWEQEWRPETFTRDPLAPKGYPLHGEAAAVLLEPLLAGVSGPMRPLLYWWGLYRSGQTSAWEHTGCPRQPASRSKLYSPHIRKWLSLSLLQPKCNSLQWNGIEFHSIISLLHISTLGWLASPYKVRYAFLALFYN